MCGIAGAISFQGSNFTITETYIAKMRDKMAHRGPDGAGVWVSPDHRLGLGHRRLSILDLSDSATQPMASADGSLHIVFNGEIYNHADLRRELRELGHTQWKTDHSDTEVILYAFKQWGIKCVERFIGMFAFAVWDAAKQELWLARDRIGIKPLYYSVHHGRMVFASEIKALLQDPEQRREVNEEAFFHYLSFLTTPAPDTLFSGIAKLPAGTWLKATPDGRLEKYKYWDVLDRVKPLEADSEEEIFDRVLTSLRAAVKWRKVSDVPVGVFLSGGIDSSTNAALFSEGEKAPVKTFCVGYAGNYTSYKNETHYARMMAETIGADYHEHLITCDELINFLPEMVRLQDEPIADPVCVPVYYVSKLARDNGVTVCQVGEGADELFCGYPLWKTALRLQQLNGLPVPPLLKQSVAGGMRLFGKQNTFAYEGLRRGLRGEPIFWGGAEAFTHLQKMALLSPRLKKKFAGLTSWEAIRPIRRMFEEKSATRDHLDWMSYLDLNFRLPELLLMRVDKMSMGVSLEARVPFLDHNFVELAMSIPPALKTKNGTLKYVLKNAVRGIIPDELINRKKQGFNVPVYELLFEGLGEKIRQEMTDFCAATDFFDRDTVKKYLANPHGKQPWYLLNFALWWKQYIAG